VDTKATWSFWRRILHGKSVLVVGAGNSGVDIACDAAKRADVTYLSMRRGYWVLPKFIAGVPTDIFFSGGKMMPKWVDVPDVQSLIELLVGRPEGYGLPAPDHDLFASHPILSSDLLSHVGHGRIFVRPDVTHIEDDRVFFADSSSAVVDEIIWATGYRTTTPYLGDVLEPTEGNRPDLWMRLVHQSVPDLYALGFIETNSSVFRLFDLGAELIAHLIGASLRDPQSRRSIDKLIADGVEPDLNGPIERVSSGRHVGYVDARLYAQALRETINTHFGHKSFPQFTAHLSESGAAIAAN
jgi:hypothetical protein